MGSNHTAIQDLFTTQIVVYRLVVYIADDSSHKTLSESNLEYKQEAKCSAV